MPLILWGLLGLAGLGAGGYFLSQADSVVHDTGTTVQQTGDSTVKVVIVGAAALWLLHESGVLKGGIKLG